MPQGVVSILDQHHYQVVENLWAEMRQRFGVGHPDVTAMPHFTYHVAEQYDEEKVSEILQEIAGQERPFSITASGIGIFPAPDPIVYVPVIRSPELNRLHAQLFPRLSAVAQNNNIYYAPDTWLPHITLGHIPLAKLGSITQWLHQQTINWTITIDNFYLLTDDTRGHVEKLKVMFRNQ